MGIMSILGFLIVLVIAFLSYCASLQAPEGEQKSTVWVRIIFGTIGVWVIVASILLWNFGFKFAIIK